MTRDDVMTTLAATPGDSLRELMAAATPTRALLRRLGGNAPRAVLAVTPLAAWFGSHSVRLTTAVGYGALLVALVLFGIGAWVGPADSSAARVRRRRLLVSTSACAIVACVAVAVVVPYVGLDALWFRRDLLGQPWRLATAALTHGSFMHLLGNMLALLAFGPHVEARIGRARMVALLAATAIAGSLAQAWATNTAMVGFSGAIYGVFGATLVLMPGRPRPIRAGEAWVAIPMWLWLVMSSVLFTAIAMMDRQGHVGWIAHVIGFAVGAALALPMRRLPLTAAFLDDEAQVRERLARRLPAPTTKLELTSADPEIAAYLRAAHRRQVRITATGGGLLFAFGGGIALAAALIDGAGSYRSQALMVAVSTAFSGVAMLAQARAIGRGQPVD